MKFTIRTIVLIFIISINNSFSQSKIDVSPTSSESITMQSDGKFVEGGNTKSEEIWWETKALQYTYYLLLIAILSLIINFFVRHSKRETRIESSIVENEDNHELNRQRTRFITNISHDIKTPLTLLLSPISDLIEQSDIPTKYLSQLKLMNTNGEIILNKINKVLKYSESEFSNNELDIVSCNLHQLVLNIVVPLKWYAHDIGVNFEFHPKMEEHSDIVIKIDRDKLESILKNLILSVLKWIPDGGKCRIEYTIIDSRIEFIVSTTEVSKDNTLNIFNQLSLIADNNREVNIDLYPVKLFIDQMGGEISVDSKKGVETSCRFNIPIEFDNIATKNIAVKGGAESDKEGDVVHMLVVNDNKDMCDYIAQVFAPYYQVTTLCDGSKAKYEIENNLPDIIISGLTLASVDGVKLCKYVKGNILTSHIPFVIISSKSDIETETICFEAGVDMFEGMPFTTKKLIVKVSSLIKNRKLLKYKYTIGIPSSAHLKNLDTKIISQESLDERFLVTVNEVLNKYFLAADFPIETLAKELSMSYEQLYRKVKTLTGLTISNYVRNYRLNCAAELLKSNKYSVTEVLYSVGFNNPSYFTRSFKKQFSVLPSEYVSDNRLT